MSTHGLDADRAGGWRRALAIVASVVAAAGGAGPGAAAEYLVGLPGSLAEIEEVPWESLEPGDVVAIHARPEPYRAKWVLCRQGTAERPIVVRGVADAAGQLPVVDGREAVTRPELDYWSEQRAVVKIGGANRPADLIPRHITIENLEIRGARPPNRFGGRSGTSDYLRNASAIYVEKGEHITIRNCVLHDCGNGLFTAHASRNVLVEGCQIYGNGIEGSILEHNSYTASRGIVFQFNHYGPLRAGCNGNNLKDRSAGTVVRYNRIEGGNRALDLVDGSDSDELRADARYRQTFVYGNLLVKLDEPGNNQVVHYGGDSGNPDRYRQGTLYFYNNTIVSRRPGTTVLLRLSSVGERADVRNNIIWGTAPGRNLALLNGDGTIDWGNNWIKQGWRGAHSADTPRIVDRGQTLAGLLPGFVDEGRGDFRLVADSPCRGAGETLHPAALAEHPVLWQFTDPRRGVPRPQSAEFDLGAFASAAEGDAP